MPAKRMDGYSWAGLVGVAFVIGWLVLRPADSETVTTGPVPVPTAPGPIRPVPTPPPPAAEAPPKKAPESITIGGDGDGNSAPFNLAGGEYRATVTFGGNCYYSIDLDDTTGEQRSKDVGSASEPLTLENFLYQVKEGRYFFGVITGPSPRCPWSVTLESQ